VITGVKNHEDLASIIKQAIGDEHYQNKLMNNGITKVIVSNGCTYRILMNSLKTNNIPWFSYEKNRIEILKL
jgi:hypothetical protein